MDLAAIKLRVRTSYRLQLLISGCIYEVTSPRYALRCFATHVETRSPPTENFHCTPIGVRVQRAGTGGHAMPRGVTNCCKALCWARNRGAGAPMVGQRAHECATYDPLAVDHGAGGMC